MLNVRPVLRHLVLVTTALAWPMAEAGCERPPLCPDVHHTMDVEVPPTRGVALPPVQRLNAHATGGPGGDLIRISIADNQGTIAFEGRGPVPAFIYERTPWPQRGTTLYAGLGMDVGVWYPFWLYCAPDGRLTHFYGEMTDTDIGVLYPVTGNCEMAGDFIELPLNLPPASLRNVALTCGFSVRTRAAERQIDLGASRPGQFSFGGETATIFPFHIVDCMDGCGSPGWYEIHSIIVSPPVAGVTAGVGFGIVYLHDQSASARVSLDFGLLLPTAVPFMESFPGATWTISR